MPRACGSPCLYRRFYVKCIIKFMGPCEIWLFINKYLETRVRKKYLNIFYWPISAQEDSSHCLVNIYSYSGPGAISSCSLLSNILFLSNSIFTIARKKLKCCYYSQYYGSQNMFVWKQHRSCCLCSSLILLAEYWLYYSWDCIIPHAFSVRQNCFWGLT